MKNFISIIAGSRSDEKLVKEAVLILKENKISYEINYLSAHREPEKLRKYILKSQKYVDVYICIAGLAAGLPGVVASLTEKPVIAVPLNVKLKGLDALLSSMQMPAGVPVATVGIDNAKNASYLAIRILKLKEK
jgi:5-(carboxyamino)imidazole ribonucleotide mutase